MSAAMTKPWKEAAVDAALRHAAQEGQELKNMNDLHAYLSSDCKFSNSILEDLSAGYLLRWLDDYQVLREPTASIETLYHQHLLKWGPQDTRVAPRPTDRR